MPADSRPCLMPRFSLEHLASVPVQVAGLRPPIRVLRVSNSPAVVGKERFPETRGPIHLIGNDQGTVRDRERPQIEGLVMEDAEGESVALDLGPASLMP